MTAKRRPSKHQLARLNEEYANRLAQILEELGCKPTEDGLYRYYIETRAGRLLVDVYPNLVDSGGMVLTRFQDVERAVELLGSNLYGSGVNEYTGKWNFHFFDVKVEEAEAALRRAFARVLGTTP